MKFHMVRYYDNITPEDMVLEFANKDEAEKWIDDTLEDLKNNEFSNVDWREYNGPTSAGIYEIDGNMYAELERVNYTEE